MCAPDDGFLLCTCPMGRPGPPDWQLQRQDISRSPRSVRGRAMRPRYPASAEELAAELNQRNCFDIAYTPQAGDVLILAQGAGQRPLRFRYTDRWALDFSTGLTGWRSQMVGLDQGCIERP